MQRDDNKATATHNTYTYLKGADALTEDKLRRRFAPLVLLVLLLMKLQSGCRQTS
jgi:hypothetical protein